MKRILFNDKYGLTAAVLAGTKTQTRRIAAEGSAPRYAVGEVVAIAQSYKSIHDMALDDDVNINADMVCIDMLKHAKDKGWRNKMFVKAEEMPHRIQITAVSKEKLQDISDNDCMVEGIYEKKVLDFVKGYISTGYSYTLRDDMEEKVPYNLYHTPQLAYAALIDAISGKGTWERNPYVYVYEFKLKKNEI